MATYSIALANLAADLHTPDNELWFWHKVRDSELIRLGYNLANLWAWNLRGNFGFESDGPAVFIKWDN